MSSFIFFLNLIAIIINLKFPLDVLHVSRICVLFARAYLLGTVGDVAGDKPHQRLKAHKRISMEANSGQ